MLERREKARLAAQEAKEAKEAGLKSVQDVAAKANEEPVKEVQEPVKDEQDATNIEGERVKDYARELSTTQDDTPVIPLDETAQTTVDKKEVKTE